MEGGGAGSGGERVDDAHDRHEDDQLRPGVATAQVRQRLEQGRQQDLERRDAPVSGILLCGQGFETTAVLCLELRCFDGKTIEFDQCLV